MASSKCVALLVLVALSSLSAASAVVIGGASSVANYDAYLVSIYPHKASIGAYSSVGSGAGIDGFIARTYAIAASDDPLTAAQSAKSPSHYTLPQVFSTYSFVVNGGTVRLTAAQVYQIYTGRIHLWSQIKGSGKSGTIRPVARSEPTGSGTTEVVTKWLLVQRSGIPASEVGLGPWHTGYKGVAYAKGTGGIVAYVKATPGAIGYAQTGIATAAGLREVAVLNHADQYVTASTGEITQALPRVLPPSAGSWAGVSLLNRPGKTTYPIASFVYLFVRQGYSGEGPLIIKPFLNFLFSVSAQAAAPKYAFTPLPASIRSKNLAAIAAIHS